MEYHTNTNVSTFLISPPLSLPTVSKIRILLYYAFLGKINLVSTAKSMAIPEKLLIEHYGRKSYKANGYGY
jgi:hypothetical protein